MKKIMLFVAILFATASISFVNAQDVQENIPVPTVSQPVFMPNTPGVVINNSNVVNNGTGIITGNQPKERTRTIYRDRPVNVNISFFSDTTKKTEVAPPPPINGNDGNDLPFYDWFNRLVMAACLAALLLVVLFLMMDWYRRRHPITRVESTTSSVVSHTHDHNHTHSHFVKPVQTKPFAPSAEEAMKRAEENGGEFMTYRDGTYSVRFSKPKEEKKPEEKKEGSIDLTKKDQSHQSGDITTG